MYHVLTPVDNQPDAAAACHLLSADILSLQKVPCRADIAALHVRLVQVVEMLSLRHDAAIVVKDVRVCPAAARALFRVPPLEVNLHVPAAALAGIRIAELGYPGVEGTETAQLRCATPVSGFHASAVSWRGCPR